MNAVHCVVPHDGFRCFSLRLVPVWNCVCGLLLLLLPQTVPQCRPLVFGPKVSTV